MQTYKPLYKVPVVATADVEAFRFVKLAGAKAGAGEKAIGISDYQFLNGETGSVVALGTCLLTLGGTVTKGDKLKSDANGKGVVATNVAVAVPAGATPVTSTGAQPTLTVSGGVLPEAVNAIALTDGVSGDVIEVFLIH